MGGFEHHSAADGHAQCCNAKDGAQDARVLARERRGGLRATPPRTRWARAQDVIFVR
jgi:hypothetical protein